MGITAVGSQSSIAIQQLVTMRAQLDDLQRQLSTGQKSANYAGLGLGRGISVSLNAQLSAIAGYDTTISTVSTRINLMNTTLGRMTDIGSAVKAAMTQANATGNSTGALSAQQTAQLSLDELLGLLNTQAGDRYLFSGRATDQPAVETMDHILNGNGAQAGLNQIISERLQADLGASGLGRLVISSPTATSVSVAEDAVSPFGLKLASVTSNLTNGTVTGPSGAPAAMTVDFSGLPNAGDTITVRYNLPDGTTTALTLTATTDAPPGANKFTIGATAADTATNFQSALTTATTTLAGTALTAASAVAASNDFFDADINNPPARVDGPPFDSATAMTTGSAADTVIWYVGDASGGSARNTSTARVDPTQVVGYGARANEDGIRRLVQNIATAAAVTISSSNPDAAELSSQLNQRLSTNINGAAGDQTIANIQADLAVSLSSITSAKDRHTQTKATLTDYQQQIQGVSNEDVAASILTLQTRMQASMQTTALLLQTSLTKYL
jgi:flagellin-like hook-associated protein FlgL